MRYTVTLHRDPAGLVVAHVPALRGWVSQGKTNCESLRNVKEAIALYVQTLMEHGQPLPAEAGRPCSCRDYRIS